MMLHDEIQDEEDSNACPECGGDGTVDYLDCPSAWGEDCPSEESHPIECPSCRGSGMIRQVTSKPMKTIVGLVGKKQAGKDTLFSIIKSFFPEAVRIAFADPVKQEVARACNVTVDFVEEHKALFRPILQWWGTEWRRKATPDYWIWQAEKAIDAAESSLVVITDVRFPNEVKVIKERGGLIVKIVRPDTESGDAHVSERFAEEYDGYDFAILNDGTPADFKRQANAVVALIQNAVQNSLLNR